MKSKCLRDGWSCDIQMCIRDRGYSVYGTDIYVREDQKAKAEALINELLYDNDYNTFEDEDIKLPWWQNKVIVAKCILGFFILVIIIMIASQIFQ